MPHHIFLFDYRLFVLSYRGVSQDVDWPFGFLWYNVWRKCYSYYLE